MRYSKLFILIICLILLSVRKKSSRLNFMFKDSSKNESFFINNHIPVLLLCCCFSIFILFCMYGYFIYQISLINFLYYVKQLYNRFIRWLFLYQTKNIMKQNIIDEEIVAALNFSNFVLLDQCFHLINYPSISANQPTKKK